jgi:hypothetical protein
MAIWEVSRSVTVSYLAVDPREVANIRKNNFTEERN